MAFRFVRGAALTSLAALAGTGFVARAAHSGDVSAPSSRLRHQRTPRSGRPRRDRLRRRRADGTSLRGRRHAGRCNCHTATPWHPRGMRPRDTSRRRRTGVAASPSGERTPAARDGRRHSALPVTAAPACRQPVARVGGLRVGGGEGGAGAAGGTVNPRAVMQRRTSCSRAAASVRTRRFSAAEENATLATAPPALSRWRPSGTKLMSSFHVPSGSVVATVSPTFTPAAKGRCAGCCRCR